MYQRMQNKGKNGLNNMVCVRVSVCVFVHVRRVVIQYIVEYIVQHIFARMLVSFSENAFDAI